MKDGCWRYFPTLFISLLILRLSRIIGVALLSGEMDFGA